MFHADTPALIAGHDELLNVKVTANYGNFDLTGYTLKIYLKATQTTADEDATQTYDTSSGLTIVQVMAGTFSWAIASADVPASGTFWYRLDLTDGGSNTYAVLGGNVNVLDA